MQSSPGFIDVHHHARPDDYLEALAAAGVAMVGGTTLPRWNSLSTLAMMDAAGIGTAVLSAPDSEFAFRDRLLATRLSRRINTLYADLIAEHGLRFGGFASLPVPHWDAALAEMTFALDELTLDGVMLNTSYGGLYLGSTPFDTLFQELDSRSAVVFVHPATPMGLDTMQLELPAYLLEFVFDTTRCIMNMIANRIPQRFPRIRFIFAHGGGTAPYLSFRLHRLTAPRRGPQLAEHVQSDLESVAHALKSFHYDTALTTNAASLQCLSAIVGGDRMVFGSDFPQVGPILIARMMDDLTGTYSDSANLPAIRNGNARKLFPRLDRLILQRA